MRPTLIRYLPGFTFVFYLLYAVSSTFSIALAQITLGLSLAGFLLFLSTGPSNPFAGAFRWFYIFITGFIGWLVVSALMGPSPMGSVMAVKEEWLFLAIPIGIYLCARDNFRRYLVTAFAVGVAILGAYGIFQHFVGIDLFRVKPLIPAPDFGYLARGTFPHMLTYGNYYAVASLFLLVLGLAGEKEFSNRRRILFSIAGVLAGTAVLLSYSRGSILALMVGLLFGCLIRGRKYWPYAIGLVVLAVGSVALVPGLADRLERSLRRELAIENKMGRPFIWKNSLRLVAENPVFGVGLGNFQKEYAEDLPDDVRPRMKHVHAHCDLLNIAASGGIPALLFYLGFWFVILSKFWNGRRGPPGDSPLRCYQSAALTASVVFLVASVTEATFADEEVRQMLMFVWAVGLGAWYKQLAPGNPYCSKHLDTRESTTLN